jgi:hypothetical protein
MVALHGAPDHRCIDRTPRSQPKGADMLSTTIKRTMATTLSGAAIAGALGAPAASAMPIDPVGAPGEPSNVWTVPSARVPPGPPTWPMHPKPITPPAAAAAVETAPDAGFDVSSAAIGAGAGLLIVVLAAGGLAWRRPIARGHSAAGA